MPSMQIRDASLFVDVIGKGSPLLLMHGGPGLDHVSLTPFRRLADRHTIILYDHRCNGRSTGAPVSTMTFDNLTADSEALREELGFEGWAVLGHSFGGHVALEYVLRYPERVSCLVLLDTAGDARWSQERAPEVLAGRRFSPATVAVATPSGQDSHSARPSTSSPSAISARPARRRSPAPRDGREGRADGSAWASRSPRASSKRAAMSTTSLQASG